MTRGTNKGHWIIGLQFIFCVICEEGHCSYMILLAELERGAGERSVAVAKGAISGIWKGTKTNLNSHNQKKLDSIYQVC